MRRLLTALTLAAATLAPAAALAQGRDMDAAGSAAGALFAGGFMLFVLFVIGISLLFFIFWVVMLIDCTKREWPEKNTWLIILIVSMLLGFHWLSAIIYYFMIKRNNVGAVAQAPVVPPTPPAAPPAA